MLVPVRSWLRKVITRLGFEQDWFLIVCGALIGTATAFGAMGFAKGLEYMHEWSGDVQSGLSVWLLPMLPMAGAMLSGIMIYLWASEAKGHGVPQVLNALIRRGGVIKIQVGIVKVIASILTVGSGGSAGTEGPIIQIGATAGSVFGQRMHVNREHLRTLVGCGAAAGLASIFNAPIAGVFFVLEILLHDFTSKTFTPIVVASVFSTAVTQAIMPRGAHAIFSASEALQGYHFQFIELPSYFVLGLICGLVGVGFNISLHYTEDVFEKLRVHPIIKPVIGAMILGILGITYVLIRHGAGLGSETGQIPPFFGNGYATIRQLLQPETYSSGHGLGNMMGLLVMATVFKCLGTSLTLGSGGSGGVFAPSLFMGAMAGAAFGQLLEATYLMPEGGSPAAYALVGMAAVVAASTHGTLTAILILFELTHDVYVLLPIMLAAVVATVVSQLIDRDSIYTKKLRRAGVLVGGGRDLTILRKIPISTVKRLPLPPEPIYPSDPLSKLVTLHAHHNYPDFVVVDPSGRYVGMVTGEDMRAALIDREAIPLLLVAELVRTDLPVITPEEMLDTVMDKFAKHDVSSLPLVEHSSYHRPLDLITRANVMKRYQQVLEED